LQGRGLVREAPVERDAIPVGKRYVDRRLVVPTVTTLAAGPEPRWVSLNRAVFELPSVTDSRPKVRPLLLLT